MNSLLVFIQNVTHQIETLQKESRLAWWNLSTTGEEKYAEELTEKQIALKKLFSSKEDFETLKKMSIPSDELLARQRKLLLDSYRENQVPKELFEEIVRLETDVEAIYTNFRAGIDGKLVSNNDLKEILVKSLDINKRERAWKASKVIGEQVEEKVLLLVKLRNEAARAAGFSNYYSMRLELNEIDETRLFMLLEQLEEMTEPYWGRYKTTLDQKLCEKFSTTHLLPWHYEDPFFQEPPRQNVNYDRFYQGKDVVEISRVFYQSIGLPVEDILQRSDLFERNGKNQHAFCISIDKKEDVRILCNIRDDEYWMGTQLHELGHAVYDKYLDHSLPYLLREPAHGSSTEAIAMLFGRLSKDRRFINQFALGDCTVDSSQTAAYLLIMARWVMVMVYFERDLYQSEGIDLNKRWWDYVERFQWLEPVSGRHKPDWAAKLHLACAPVYYQDYLLGEMTASQLHHAMGDLLAQQAGEFLKKRFFALGARFPWEDALQHATGEKLNPSYFVEHINLGFEFSSL